MPEPFAFEADPIDPALVVDYLLSDEPLDSETLERVQSWRIADAGAAEWAMAHVARCNAAVAATHAQAAVWQSRLDSWVAAQIREPARFAAFLTNQLVEYGIAYREATGAATLVVPSGKVKTSDRKARPVIAEDGSVVAWLEELGDEMPEGAIKKSPLISKFNDRLAIASRPTGRTLLEVACCGALLTIEGSPGPTVLCSNCGQEGEVVHAEAEEVEVVVDKPTGEVVPGMTVVARHFTATVTPEP